MPQPQLRLIGYRELKRDIRRMGDEAKAGLKQVNKEAADIVATTARPLVPVRSGRLLGTLRTSGTMRGGVIRMGRKAVPYAGPIHFGWPSRPNQAKGWRGGPIEPNPFLYDAMDRRVPEVMAAYMAYLEDLPMSRKFGFKVTKRP